MTRCLLVLSLPNTSRSQHDDLAWECYRRSRPRDGLVVELFPVLSPRPAAHFLELRFWRQRYFRLMGVKIVLLRKVTAATQLRASNRAGRGMVFVSGMEVCSPRRHPEISPQCIWWRLTKKLCPTIIAHSPEMECALGIRRFSLPH